MKIKVIPFLTPIEFTNILKYNLFIVRLNEVRYDDSQSIFLIMSKHDSLKPKSKKSELEMQKSNRMVK